MENVMAFQAIAAKLPPMTSDEQESATRGRRIDERIKAGRFKKVRVAQVAGVSRQTLDNAIKGKAPDSTHAIESALDTLEDQLAHPEDYADRPAESAAERIAAGADLIEFEITGDFGVRVVARGSRADHEILAADVARIVREIRASAPPTPVEGSPAGD